MIINCKINHYNIIKKLLAFNKFIDFIEKQV